MFFAFQVVGVLAARIIDMRGVAGAAFGSTVVAMVEFVTTSTLS